MRSLLLAAGAVAAVGLAREATRSAGSSVRIGRYKKEKRCEEMLVACADALWLEGREEWDLTDPGCYERMEDAFSGKAPCLDLILDAEDLSAGGRVRIGKGYADVHFSLYWGEIDEWIPEGASQTEYDAMSVRAKSWLSSRGMDSENVYYEKDETIREMPDFDAVSQAILAIEHEFIQESSDASGEMRRFISKRVSFRNPKGE